MAACNMFEKLSLQNFLSFKDKTEFDFTASQEKPKKGFEYIKWMEEVNKKKLLKAQFIFGNNGTGKSNFLSAFSILQNLVCQKSDSKSNDNLLFGNCAFKLSDATKEYPSSIEVIFHIRKVRYSYSISFNESIISYERLTRQEISKKTVVVFERTFNKDKDIVEVSFPSRQIPEASRAIIKSAVLKNASVISVYDEKNIEAPDLRDVYQYFANMLIINNLDRLSLPQMIERRKDKEVLKPILISLLSDLGSSIVDYKVKPIESTLDEKEAAIWKILLSEEEYQRRYGTGTRKQLLLEFAHYADNTDGKEWLTENEESNGTLNMIRLIIALYDAMRTHSTVVVDECAAGIHQQTFGRIIQFYLSASNDTQCFMASQQTAIMEMAGFRRDTLRFFDKDRMTGISSCKKVDLRKYHKNINISKVYLDQSFGCLPEFPTQSEWEDKIQKYKAIIGQNIL